MAVYVARLPRYCSQNKAGHSDLKLAPTSTDRGEYGSLLVQEEGGRGDPAVNAAQTVISASDGVFEHEQKKSRGKPPNLLLACFLTRQKTIHQHTARIQHQNALFCTRGTGAAFEGTSAGPTKTLTVILNDQSRFR